MWSRNARPHAGIWFSAKKGPGNAFQISDLQSKFSNVAETMLPKLAGAFRSEISNFKYSGGRGYLAGSKIKNARQKLRGGPKRWKI